MRTERASAQLTLQEASSVSHSLCGGRISGKQLQRGSLIRSQPNSAGSSLYRLPGASRTLLSLPTPPKAASALLVPPAGPQHAGGPHIQNMSGTACC